MAIEHFFAALAFESLRHPEEALEQHELFLEEGPGNPVASKARAKVTGLRQVLQR
jgi:hypothetical protein